MHRLSTSFVLGFHGCSKQVADRLIDGENFQASENEYDWLGHGTYFWEANPARGLDFYKEVCRRKGHPEEDACVVGAVIDLGFCLDLTSLDAADLIRNAFSDLKEIYELSAIDMPKNEGGRDSVFRNLDCAVINHIHQSRSDAGEQPFDSVKGFFQEGDPIYDNSGFFEKTHIQIAVRHSEQIKGVFRVTI